MKGRIKIVTLAVDDLEAALCCYRDGLGLNTDGIVGQEFGDGLLYSSILNRA